MPTVLLIRHAQASFGAADYDVLSATGERQGEIVGLTMDELASAMQELGAVKAINLDGGGSASLVVSGALLNTSREEHGRELLGCREIAAALQLFPR